MRGWRLGGWATEGESAGAGEVGGVERERVGFGVAIAAEESLLRSAEMCEMKVERIVRQRCIWREYVVLDIIDPLFCPTE